MIVTGERVAAFVSDALGFGLCPPWIAIGIERNGAVVAGVLLNVFESCSVHMTAAGKGWTREFLIAVGDYVFGALECQRITSITESPNVVSLAKRLGGAPEGIMRNQFGYGRDGIVIGFLKEDWKYRTRAFN